MTKKTVDTRPLLKKPKLIERRIIGIDIREGKGHMSGAFMANLVYEETYDTGREWIRKLERGNNVWSFNGPGGHRKPKPRIATLDFACVMNAAFPLFVAIERACVEEDTKYKKGPVCHDY